MPKSKGPHQGTRKKLSNRPRERGNSPPARSVQTFEVGQRVHLRIDPSVPKGRFHPRFVGHTGEVVGTQGAAYKVEITDGSTEKTIITHPAHLRPQRG